VEAQRLIFFCQMTHRPNHRHRTRRRSAPAAVVVLVVAADIVCFEEDSMAAEEPVDYMAASAEDSSVCGLQD